MADWDVVSTTPVTQASAVPAGAGAGAPAPNDQWQPVKSMPAKDDYIQKGVQYANEYRVRPDVFLSIINQESGFNRTAKSSTGVRGISQMTLDTGKKYGIMNEADRSNPDKMLKAGAAYFKDLLVENGGNYAAAVRAYNGGSDPNYLMNVGRHLSWARQQIDKLGWEPVSTTPGAVPDLAGAAFGGTGQPGAQAQPAPGAAAGPPGTQPAITGATPPELLTARAKRFAAREHPKLPGGPLGPPGAGAEEGAAPAQPGAQPAPGLTPDQLAQATEMQEGAATPMPTTTADPVGKQLKVSFKQSLTGLMDTLDRVPSLPNADALMIPQSKELKGAIDDFKNQRQHIRKLLEVNPEDIDQSLAGKIIRGFGSAPVGVLEFGVAMELGGLPMVGALGWVQSPGGTWEKTKGAATNIGLGWLLGAIGGLPFAQRVAGMAAAGGGQAALAGGGVKDITAGAITMAVLAGTPGGKELKKAVEADVKPPDMSGHDWEHVKEAVKRTEPQNEEQAKAVTDILTDIEKGKPTTQPEVQPAQGATAPPGEGTSSPAAAAPEAVSAKNRQSSAAGRQLELTSKEQNDLNRLEDKRADRSQDLTPNEYKRLGVLRDKVTRLEAEKNKTEREKTYQEVLSAISQGNTRLRDSAVDYAKALDKPIEEIATDLRQAGLSEADVSGAIKAVYGQTPAPTIAKEPIASPRALGEAETGEVGGAARPLTPKDAQVLIAQGWKPQEFDMSPAVPKGEKPSPHKAGYYLVSADGTQRRPIEKSIYDKIAVSSDLAPLPEAKAGEVKGGEVATKGTLHQRYGIAENAPGVYWHGTPSGDLRGGTTGLHVGTFDAAQQALNARIGIPAEGEWDGTREYGKTLLAGKKRLLELDPKGFNQTGVNAGTQNNSIPEENYYPDERTGAYSDALKVALTAKPNIFPVRIKGEMTNSPRNPHEDFKANALMGGQIKKGTAKRGYYYEQVGEDAGSISAVVPNAKHLERIEPTAAPQPAGEGKGEKLYGGGPETGPFIKKALNNAGKSSVQAVRDIGEVVTSIRHELGITGSERGKMIIEEMMGRRRASTQQGKAALLEWKDRLEAIPLNDQYLEAAKYQQGRETRPDLKKLFETWKSVSDWHIRKINELGARSLQYVDNYIRGGMFTNYGDPKVTANQEKFFAGKPFANHLYRDESGNPRMYVRKQDAEGQITYVPTGKVGEAVAPGKGMGVSGYGRGKTLTGGRGYFKQKVFSSWMEPLMVGYQPKYGLFDLLMTDIKQKGHYIYGMKAWQQARKEGYIKFFGPGQQPARWVQINDPMGRVTAAYAEKETGTPRVAIKQAYAEPKFAKVFNNFLSEGLRGKPWYDKGRAVMDTARLAGVSFTPFHAKVTFNNDVATGIGEHGIRAMGDLLTGDAEGAAGHAKQVAKAVSGVKTVKNMGEARKAAMEFYKPGSNTMYREGIDDYVMAGGTMPEPEVTQGIGKGLADGLKGVARDVGDAHLLRATYKAAQTTSLPIMRYMVPYAKLMSFLEKRALALPEWQKQWQGKQDTPEAEMDWRRRLRQAREFDDSMYGQIARDNFHFSNSVKDGLFFLIKYPGWNLGSGKWILGNIKGSYQGLRKLVTGKPMGGFEKMSLKYTAGLIAKTMIFNTLLYMGLHGGKTPDNHKELITKGVWTGGYNRDGSKQYIRDADYMRDLVGYYTDPLGTLRSKSPDIIRLPWEMLSNEDYFGNKPYTPREPAKWPLEFGKQVVKSFAPYSIQQAFQGRDKFGKYGQLVGMTLTPQRVSRDKSEDIIAKHYQKHASKGQTPAETKKYQKLMQLEDIAEHGANPEFKSNLKKMEKAGELTARQAQNVKEKVKNVKAYRFKGLPVDVAVEAYQAGTPEEKAIYGPLLRHKINNLSDRDRAKYRQYRDFKKQIEEDEAASHVGAIDTELKRREARP